MKKAQMLAFALAMSFSVVACGGTKGSDEALEVPTDMPEICKNIDFVSQPDMREVCGVRVARYKSYKNIPMQRYLVNPKDASLVKSDGKVELRLPNTLPIQLDSSMSEGFAFTQDKRLEKIRNTMEYKELFPTGGERVKMFRLNIPREEGSPLDLCFRVPNKKGNDRTRMVAMGNEIESMTCADFEMLVAKYSK